jgi:hypothetical protein
MQTKLVFGVGILMVLFISTYLGWSPNAPEHTDQIEAREQLNSVKNTSEEKLNDPVSPTSELTEPTQEVQLQKTQNTQEQSVCPDDVKVCSSGGYGVPNSPTYLHRIPPNCEFPECPG